MIAAAGPTPLWYAARSTGYVSLLLLTAIVVLGTLVTMRWRTVEWPRFLVQALHRNLALLTLVFLAIHIATSVIDPFAGITWLNTVVPFTGSYRPIWIGLGVVSMELLAALVVTSLLRHRLPFALWRAIHWTAYACWPVAVLHTLGTGSDVRSGWGVLIDGGCVALVVVAIGWRVLADRARLPAPGRVAAVTTVAAATVALAGFALAGPLHSGWARAAGTPARLLALASPSASAAAASASPSPALQAGLRDQLSGQVLQRGDTVDVRLSDVSDPSLSLDIAARGGASTAALVISRAGAAICQATANVVQDVVATCGATSVDITLMQQPDGSITGQLVTSGAP